MKIVNILGGLGNQMFNYALYLALKDAHPEEDIFLSTRSFKGYGLHNGFELDKVFGVTFREASLGDLSRLAYPFLGYRTWQFMNHVLPKRKSMAESSEFVPFNYSEVTRSDSVFYDGYWLNEGYFAGIRERIVKAYSFPPFEDERNMNLALKLVGCNAVSCHVRRGDYLRHPERGVCTPEYYKAAIEKMNSLVDPSMYCVFSDDIDWCRENLGPMMGDRDVVYVSWNKGSQSFQDMHLMTLCRHSIIANSSFSWWGAWLGPGSGSSSSSFTSDATADLASAVPTGRIVIAPSRWMTKDIVNDPICSGWIRI